MAEFIYESLTGNDDGDITFNVISIPFDFNGTSLAVGRLPNGNDLFAGSMLRPSGGAGTGCEKNSIIISAFLRCFVVQRLNTPLLQGALDDDVNPSDWGNLGDPVGTNHPFAPYFIPASGDYTNAPSVPAPNNSFDINVTPDAQILVNNASWNTSSHTRCALRPQPALGNGNFCSLSAFEAGAGVHIRLIITTAEGGGTPNLVVRDSLGNVRSSGDTIAMGTTPDGVEDTEQITVQNTGDAILAINSVVPTGGADFDTTEDLAATIAAGGGSDQMTVRRLADVVGAQTRTITINSDDPTTPEFIINFSSTVLQRYIEVQSPTGEIINPPNPNTTRFSIGTIEVTETASKRLKVFGRLGDVETDGSTVPYIDANIYNTLTSEWFTKSNSLLDQRGGNDLVEAETLVYTLETVGSNGTFYSATFDGSADWAKVDDIDVSPDPCPSGVPFYWHVWFNTAVITNSVLMAKWNISTAAKKECRLIFLTASALLQFQYRGTNGTEYEAIATASPSTSSWQHALCGVDSSGNIHIYLNGANGATTAVAAAIVAGDAPFTIGSYDTGSSKYDGKMIAPRVVVGVAPSAALATALYNSGTPLDLDDPFSITENIPTGTTLNGTEDNLTVEFTPVAEQTYDATIVIPSDSLDSPNQTLIRGIGSAAAGTITVEDETPTVIPNSGTLDLDNPDVNVGEDEQLTITAIDDDVEIASIRMNDPTGSAQDYSLFPLMATRNRQAFVDAYAGAATGIFREVYSGASDEAYPGQQSGLRKTLWGHYETWRWNQDKYSVMLPTAPPFRLQTAKYGEGSNDSCAELITGCWTFTTPGTSTSQSLLDNWGDFDIDPTTIFGFNTRPKKLSKTAKLTVQWCADGSNMDGGFETWINGYDGTNIGNGVAKFFDDSAGAIIKLIIPTNSGGAYGKIDYEVTWTTSPALTATRTVLASGTLTEGTHFDARRGVAGIAADEYHILHELGTFDFRAAGGVYLQLTLWANTDNTDDCGITTGWPETANAASQKGRTRISLSRSGSDFLQMLSNYANGGSMLALFAPDLIEVGGFGNYARRTPTKSAADLIDDLQNYIDFLRGIVAGVPIIVDGGWNLYDGSDDTNPPAGLPLDTDKQLLVDTFSSIAYSIDRDTVALMNYRRYLEAVGWDNTDIPADEDDHDGTTIDGTDPAWEGAKRICEGQYACHEELIMLQFTEEIADATTILQDATDTFTIDNTAIITGAYASHIGPTLTNIVITHDQLDSPHIINVTGTVGAVAIIQLENETQVIPPYSLAEDYYTDFGTVGRDVPSSVTFTITNIGTISLGIQSVTNAGASPDFVIVQDVPLFTVLDPGESTTFVVRMRSSLLGEKFSNVLIAHDGVDTDDETDFFRILFTGHVADGGAGSGGILNKKIKFPRYPRTDL